MTVVFAYNDKLVDMILLLHYLHTKSYTSQIYH